MLEASASGPDRSPPIAPGCGACENTGPRRGTDDRLIASVPDGAGRMRRCDSARIVIPAMSAVYVGEDTARKAARRACALRGRARWPLPVCPHNHRPRA